MHAASLNQPPKSYSSSVGLVGAVAVSPLFKVIASGAVPCPFALKVTVTFSGVGGVFSVHLANNSMLLFTACEKSNSFVHAASVNQSPKSYSSSVGLD